MATAKKEASTEVAVKPEMAPTVLGTQFLEDAGAGFEEAGATAYAIPFLQMLQSGSPQCKKSDGAYISGAEEGKFFNTVTQELYDGGEGIVVIPCHFTNRFNEWKTRESGGGFVTEHMVGTQPATTKDSKGRDIAENGNVIADTRNHYVLICNADGTLTPAILSLTSTQLKKSRQWMSKMQGFKIRKPDGSFDTAPMSSRKYRLTTVPESNDKGSWFGLKVELEGLVEDAAEYNEAAKFRQAIRSGTAKAASTAEESF